MNNSGNNANYETGAWTNLENCGVPTTAVGLRNMVCGDTPLTQTPENLSVTNGVTANVFEEWLSCWDQQTPIEATIPVIDCSGGISNCSPIVGTVKVYIIWITGTMPGSPNSPNFWNNTPTQMAGFEGAVTDVPDFSCAGADPPQADHTEGCWQAFTEHFNLQTPD